MYEYTDFTYKYAEKRRRSAVKERKRRLAEIRRIIEARPVDSQEALLEMLTAEGIAVTQATLSRDLKFLGVGKIPDGRGGYQYSFPDAPAKPASDRELVEDILRGFVSISFSGPLGLIRTLPGHAGSVASAIDTLGIAEILGTIAGDDTLLVVPRDGVNRRRILKALEERIPGLRESMP